MKTVQWFVLLLFLSALPAYGQLPSKVKKMAGTWEYKQGSGFESWELQGNELIGHAFRVNVKTGDTSKVEDMTIRKPSKHLVYVIETINYVDDSLMIRAQNFIADRKKMKFYNMTGQTPHAIEYSFGFFSKKKLKLKIYHGPFDKPLKLVLFKVI
ncbi:MAG: hypothetical protein ACI865_000868 [Flavobacteriaceae bacterium]|jgi:hypothetical protein